MSTRSRTRRGESGASALEFALVAPVIFLLLFGILQYGYLYWSLQTAAASAREGARLMAVNTQWPCAQNWVQARAADAAVGGAPTVTIDRSTVSPIPIRTLVTVTVRMPSLDLRLFPVPNGGIVTQSATARVENTPAAFLPCPASYVP